jgi:hypothetical protein
MFRLNKWGLAKSKIYQPRAQAINSNLDKQVSLPA